MKKLGILFSLLLLVSCSTGQESEAVSGKIYQGYRILTVPLSDQDVHFTVYRGDYVKFVPSDKRSTLTVSIPDLDIQKSFSGDIANDPYIKLKKAGQYAMDINGNKGIIKVLQYEESYYTELTAREAYDFIQSKSPFILDVRTPREYASGHIANANLIPVQVLQDRVAELSDYKNKDILVYCRSGNRSTVASKILIDAGFRRVVNLRTGIIGWQNDHFPMEQ